VAATAFYFVAFGFACFLAPARVEKFLLGFATSAQAHYAELAVRMLVGWALILRAPWLRGAALFELLGWVLVVTTAVMACLPWKWHQRIAERAVPRALRHLQWMGAAALAAGAVLGVALAVGAQD
jgi:mannose/fructose/N-acetylgalactosamine-specific phosphotransferase system component IIC